MEGVLNPSSLPAPSHMDGTLASQYLGGGASGGSGGKGGRSNLSFQEDYITNQQGNIFLMINFLFNLKLKKDSVNITSITYRQ